MLNDDRLTGHVVHIVYPVCAGPFDRVDDVHTVERAAQVGSLEQLISPDAMRAHIISQLEASDS